MIKKIKKNSFGFTMIEISLTIFITMLVGMAIWSFQKNVFSLNTFISGDITAQEEARRAFKTMSEEIRSTSPASNGSYAIFEASSTSFTFYSDIDDDGLKERLRYFLDGTILKKGVIKPTVNPVIYNQANEIVTSIINNIYSTGSSIFEYYDANYDGSTFPLSYPINLFEIRLIKITVTIDQNPYRPPAPLVMSTQVSMRNLKDN